ncbi:MAG: adenylyltransferase/cytidyltransferase family protein [Planctomycetes bacterium]|nr:adenylyltransferase/cytidyltransferase family protein [Planctomycetota bacterium]
MRPSRSGAEKTVPDYRDLARPVADARARGKRIVITNGGFDLLHVGHLRSLEAAAEEGDLLIVAVNSDASVRRAKGPRRPVVPLAERMELLAALSCVDYVTSFDEPTAGVVLRLLRPHVHAKGTDYSVENDPERQTVAEIGAVTVITGDPKNHSVTDLIERVRK